MNCESTYENFILKYEYEVLKHINIIRKMNNDDIINIIDDNRNIYDKNLCDMLSYLISRKLLTINEIANIAIDNQNKNGTETKMICNLLDAITCTYSND